MRIVVLGAGAVGSLFGARLAGAGQSVRLIARPAHVAAVRARGLEVVGVRAGRFAVEAAEDLEGAGPVDAALLGVKTFDLEPAAGQLARAFPRPLPVLAPQNGLGVAESVERGLRQGGWADPQPWIVLAVHSVPATLLGPGQVRQAGDGEILLPEVGPASSEALRCWSEVVPAMGYPVRHVPDFAREVWRKAILNAAINPVTADHGVVNGRLREDPWRGQALALLEEARQVAAADGIPFSAAELEADLWRVVRGTAENRSSMLQDLDRGRPTEIEHISGRLVEIGERHGLALPATRRALSRIRDRAAAGAREAALGGRPPKAS